MKKKISSNGKFLNVKKEKRILPNGNEISLMIVEHPGAVLIVPHIGRDRYILLRQYRPVIARYIYEFPAGTLEVGEKERACAIRETMEETGHKPKKITKMGYIFPAPGYTTERIAIFLAEKLEKVDIHPEKDEVIETVFLNKKELLDLVGKGKITDSKTLSSLVICGII